MYDITRKEVKEVLKNSAGSTFVVEKWSTGYLIEYRIDNPPVLPPGYYLKDIAIGLQYNCNPPHATKLLLRSDKD